MVLDALGDPRFLVADRLGELAAPDRVADQLLERPGLVDRLLGQFVELLVAVVGQHETVITVEQREAF